MKRIGLIGLCFAALLAFIAVATATASAEPPEYGRCIKKALKTGSGFSDAGCTKAVAVAATYEWSPGPGPKANFTTKMTTASATLETVKGTKVICTSQTSPGEFSGPKTINLTSVTFKGCKSSGLACSSTGAAAEEIKTNQLTETLRIEKIGVVEGKETPSKDKLATEIAPTSNPLFVEFECSTFKVEVRIEKTGGLLHTIVPDKMLLTSTNKFVATKGEQKPSIYEPVKGTKVEAGLESNFAGGPFEEAGQTLTNTQTNEEKIEANAVV